MKTYCKDIDIFQFTPLREGRLREKVAKFLDTIFQFTPLREGRRVPFS